VGLVCRSLASRASGDVEGDRDARAIELIAQGTQSTLRTESGCEFLELDRHVEAVEALAVEEGGLERAVRRAGIGDR
jgi:hypothetical protein